MKILGEENIVTYHYFIKKFRHVNNENFCHWDIQRSTLHNECCYVTTYLRQ